LGKGKNIKLFVKLNKSASESLNLLRVVKKEAKLSA